MPLNKEIKNLKGFHNARDILNQYIVSYNISSLSRYKHIDEILLADNKTIKKTLGPIDLSILPHDGINTYLVTASDENRIDIIAYNIYGAASLYWVLCYMNNIKDPLNIPEGTVLVYPNLSSLTRYPNPLS